MGAADCSMAAPGPMLPLCQDLTSLDYHHNIHQLSSTPPLQPPPPTPRTPPPPLTHSQPPHPTHHPSPPPAGSSLNDTLSICLIISPRAAALSTAFFWSGRSFKGRWKTLQDGLPDCSPRGPHSHRGTIGTTLSSSQVVSQASTTMKSKSPKENLRRSCVEF